MKKVFLTILVVLGLMVMPFVASAAYIDFIITPSPSAQLSYAGGTAPLIGSNLLITGMMGQGTPLNSGDYNPVLSGVLNFSTGASTGGWNWGSGGSITIQGGTTLSIPGSTPITLPITATLLSGTSVSGEASGISTAFYRFNVALIGFQDTKIKAITDHYGYKESQAWLGNVNISFLLPTSIANGQAFATNLSYPVFSGDVVNHPVPIPPTVLLLGAGLMGIGFVRKRIV
jgi:hypothetical protein